MKEIKEKKKPAKKESESIKLVKMKRDGKTADVHPLEVDSYKAAGFQAV